MQCAWESISTTMEVQLITGRLHKKVWSHLNRFYTSPVSHMQWLTTQYTSYWNYNLLELSVTKVSNDSQYITLCEEFPSFHWLHIDGIIAKYGSSINLLTKCEWNFDSTNVILFITATLMYMQWLGNLVQHVWYPKYILSFCWPQHGIRFPLD